MKKMLKEGIKKILIGMELYDGIRYITTIIRRRNPKVLYNNLKYRKRQRLLSNYLPIPPDNLIFLVTGLYDVQWFIESGRMTAESIVNTLKKNKLDIDEFNSILDFGCGCGRIIRHWGSVLSNVEIYGTDNNPKLIAWCKKHLPFAHFSTNKNQQKLKYRDGKFDFIYAISVFTHLTELGNLFWIKELSRVLKHGGYLLITTHGEYYLPQMTPEERDRFLAHKLVVRQENIMGMNICATFHPLEYVYKEFTKNGLTVIDFIPQGAIGTPHQDIFLFQKIK